MSHQILNQFKYSFIHLIYSLLRQGRERVGICEWKFDGELRRDRGSKWIGFFVNCLVRWG
jgi:hypothetical protein